LSPDTKTNLNANEPTPLISVASIQGRIWFFSTPFIGKSVQQLEHGSMDTNTLPRYTCAMLSVHTVPAGVVLIFMD
jgi:hypothetical protein